MAHWARVKGGIVTQVIVAEEEYFQTYVDDEPGEWIQTSYNTRAGQHDLGGTPLRKNYAGIGFSYDSTRDAFIPPQPYPSWILDEDSCQWEAPVAYPDDGQNYKWNETITNWEQT